MAVFRSRLTRLFAGLVVVGGVASGAAVTTSVSASTGGTHVCSGTVSHPGVLSGTYSSVVVSGDCVVNAGPATVRGDLTILRGGGLLAAFARNDHTGQGSSKLTVDGNLTVEERGTLLLGCDPQSFPCFDDPHPSSPTLSSPGYVGKDLDSDSALGVIVHNTIVGWNVTQNGGGGGVNCTPQGVFKSAQTPVYSTYEDSTVLGSLHIQGLHSCWLGVNRTHVGGGVQILNNQFADPDAIEILGNDINGDLTCRGNSMAWDGHELGNSLYPRADVPNTVGGTRSGQCFRSTPTTKGGPYGPPNSF